MSKKYDPVTLLNLVMVTGLFILVCAGVTTIMSPAIRYMLEKGYVDHYGTVREKGELHPNDSPISETVSDYEWHLYQYSGERGDRIRISVQPPPDSVAIIYLYSTKNGAYGVPLTTYEEQHPHYDNPYQYDRMADALSHQLGGEAAINASIKWTGIYLIQINLDGNPGSYTLQLIKH